MISGRVAFLVRHVRAAGAKARRDPGIQSFDEAWMAGSSPGHDDEIVN
jgi:hypothetical protein